MCLIEAHESHIRWGLRFDAPLFDGAVALDADSDTLITRTEVDARIEAMIRYASEHLRVSTDGVPCDDFRWNEYDVDNDENVHVVDASGEIHCPQPLGVVELSNTVLLDQSRDYRQLGFIRTRGGRLELQFSWNQTSVSLPIAEPYVPPEQAGTSGEDGEGDESGESDRAGEIAETLRPSTLRRLGRFIVLGVEHIVPKGVDHILFIIGLVVVSVRLRTLVGIVTAFTIAHSITLALAAFDVVRIPIAFAEAMIAASIVWVGVENLLTKPKRRALLAFAFGLIHGIGFSSVLAGLVAGVDVTTGEKVQQVLGFNVGVELGQLIVVICVFPIVLLAARAGKDAWLRVPVSLGIAVFGAIWFWQRTFGG